jgi:hypothetical protein
LSKSCIFKKPVDDVTTTEVLDLLDIGLYLSFKILDLHFILLSELLNVLIENLILAFLFFRQRLVFSEEFDLLFEDLLII